MRWGRPGNVSWFGGEEEGGRYHLGVGDEAALDDVVRFRPEPSWAPDDKVRELADLDAPNQVAEALCNGRVDRILAHIALHPKVIRASPLVFRQIPPLDLVLVRRVPRPENYLPAAAHGLRVGRHHADCPFVVEDVFGRNRLGPDARLGKRHVLGYVFG